MNLELSNQILSTKKPSNLLSEVKDKLNVCVGFMVKKLQVVGLAIVQLKTAFGSPDKFALALALLVQVRIGTIYAN